MDNDICSCGHTRAGHFDEQDRPCRDSACGCPGFREIRLPFKVEVTPFCPPRTAYLVSESLDEKGQTKTEIVKVKNIGPAEEAKPAPAPESVYERARAALHDGFYGVMNPAPCRAIHAALDAGEKAERNYRWMVEHAADNKLDGYRELASKLCTAEERAEKAEARVMELEAERDEAREQLKIEKTRRASVENECYDASDRIADLKTENQLLRDRNQLLRDRLNPFMDVGLRADAKGTAIKHEPPTHEDAPQCGCDPRARCCGPNRGYYDDD